MAAAFLCMPVQASCSTSAGLETTLVDCQLIVAMLTRRDCFFCCALTRHAACSASDVWLPDLAWAAGVKGMTSSQGNGSCDSGAAAAAVAGSACKAGDLDSSPPAGAAQQQQPPGNADAGPYHVDGVAVGEVSWRRLHAMGPTALLRSQMELGLLASLSTTQ
jgi:hypothetical protein